MEVVHPRCAALDLVKDELVACVRVQEEARARQECRTFATTVKHLLALSEWMASEGVTEHSSSERRAIVVGHSLEGPLLVVSFTDRGSNIRLISARPATRLERRDYEEAK